MGERMYTFRSRTDVKCCISTLRFAKQMCLKKCSEYGNYITQQITNNIKKTGKEPLFQDKI
jgi:hypothetical protein